MIIEFVGLPGSGKTTLARSASRQLKIPLKYNLMAGHEFSSLINCKLRFLLKFHRFFGKKVGIYDTWAFDVLQSNQLIQSFLAPVTKALSTYASNLNEKNLLHFPFIKRSLERDFVFSWVAHNNKKNAINDDGVFQRILSLNWGARGDGVPLEDYDKLISVIVKSLPSEIVVIFVDLDSNQAISRCQTRPNGLPKLLRSDDRNIQLDFENSNQFIVNLKNILAINNVRTISIKGDNLIQDNVSIIKKHLEKQINSFL